MKLEKEGQISGSQPGLPVLMGVRKQFTRGMQVAQNWNS
jgi:hypothetical protein